MTTTQSNLTTVTAAHSKLGISRVTLGKAMATLGITTQRVPHSPNGKGITTKDMARLSKHFAKSK